MEHLLSKFAESLRNMKLEFYRYKNLNKASQKSLVSHSTLPLILETKTSTHISNYLTLKLNLYQRMHEKCGQTPLNLY